MGQLHPQNMFLGRLGTTWYNISAEHLANQQRFHQPIHRKPSVTPIHQATVIMRHPLRRWMVIGCPCTRQASVGPHSIFVAPALERPILAEGVAVVQIGAVLLVLFWAGGWMELGVGGGKLWEAWGRVCLYFTLFYIVCCDDYRISYP